jgi:hypothetical protein
MRRILLRGLMRGISSPIVIGIIPALAAAASYHFEWAVPCALSCKDLKHVFAPIVSPNAVHAKFLPIIINKLPP